VRIVKIPAAKRQFEFLQVKLAKAKAEGTSSDPSHIIGVLETLRRLNPTLGILQETHIGKDVKTLKKFPDEQVKALAKELVAQYTALISRRASQEAKVNGAAMDEDKKTEEFTNEEEVEEEEEETKTAEVGTETADEKKSNEESTTTPDNKDNNDNKEAEEKVTPAENTAIAV